MHGFVALTLVALAVAPSARANSNVAPTSFDLGGEYGIVRVEFLRTAPEGAGIIDVTRVRDSFLIQKIPIKFSEAPDSELIFKLMDVNGDGHQDLLFYNSRTGTAGATNSAEVLLWVPKRKQFVRTKTLSGAGEISKARKPGCVEVTTKCSAISWWTRTFCFNNKTGLWRVEKNDHCPAPTR